jgi:hypothetical protein
MAKDNLRVSSDATRKLGPIQSGTFELSCDTATNPLKLVQLNETTGRYDVVRTVSEEEYAAHKISKRRRLFFQSNDSEPLYANAVTDSSSPDSSNSMTSSSGSSDSLFDSTRRRLQDTPLFLEGDPDALLLARECLCAPVVIADDTSMGTFCPVGQDFCRVDLPSSYRANLEVTCKAETQDFHARYTLPLGIFMSFMFVFLCLCSPKGRLARGYAKKVVRCWSDDRYEQSLNETLDRMIQLQHDRRMRLQRLRAYQIQSGRIAIPTVQSALAGTRLPLSSPIEIAHRSIVVLKTMKYKGDVQLDQEEEMCAICLNNFHEGDRVGNIKCSKFRQYRCCMFVSLL